MDKKKIKQPTRPKSTRSTSTLCDEGDTESEKIKAIERRARDTSNFDIGQPVNRNANIPPLARTPAPASVTRNTPTENIPADFLNVLPGIANVPRGEGPTPGVGTVKVERTLPEIYNPMGRDAVNAVCEEFSERADQQHNQISQLVSKLTEQMNQISEKIRVVSNAQEQMRQENNVWKRGVLVESTGIAPTEQPTSSVTVPVKQPQEIRQGYQDGATIDEQASNIQATQNRNGIGGAGAARSSKIYREDAQPVTSGNYSRPSQRYRDRSLSRSPSPPRRGGMFGRPKG